MTHNKTLIILFLLFFTVFSYAQNKFTGTVKNSKDKPVANALIFLDSINSGIKTNKKGVYFIDAKDDVASINVFSYKYGLLSSEVGMEKVINFVYLEQTKNKRLKNSAKVVLKYSKSENKYIAESIPKVKIDKQSIVYTSIYDMIRVSVSGVIVTGNTITIRGVNSMNSSTEPLFLVDGIPVSSISNIFPSNVKSIKLLKGPDTSLYGVRGANGVILIKLKS